jgi:hypothetical protein
MSATLLTPTRLAPTEIVDDVTRRQFLAMVTAAGLLAACGDDGDTVEGADTVRAFDRRRHRLGLLAGANREVTDAYLDGTRMRNRFYASLTMTRSRPPPRDRRPLRSHRHGRPGQDRFGREHRPSPAGAVLPGGSRDHATPAPCPGSRG